MQECQCGGNVSVTGLTKHQENTMQTRQLNVVITGYGAWTLDVWFDKIPAENAALPSHSGTSRDPNLMDGLLLISGS